MFFFQMTSFFISAPGKEKWNTVLKHEEMPGSQRECMLIRLQFCDMVPNEQKSTSITSACQINPHSSACSLTTPSKAFINSRLLETHRLHTTTKAYTQAHMHKETQNDNCSPLSFNACNLEEIIHVGFALTEEQWIFLKCTFPVQKVKNNSVPVGLKKKTHNTENKKERGGKKKKENLHPCLDFTGTVPAASFLPPSLPPFLLPPPLCVLELQSKGLETFQRSVTNEDHMCAAPLELRTKLNCKSLLSAGGKADLPPSPITHPQVMNEAHSGNCQLVSEQFEEEINHFSNRKL